MTDTVKKYAIIVVIVLGFGLGAFALTQCNLSRSPLVKDKSLPMSCRIFLDCLYYQQKGDKGGCTSVFGEGCKADLAYNFCDKRVGDASSAEVRTLKYNLCMAKHGK